MRRLVAPALVLAALGVGVGLIFGSMGSPRVTSKGLELEAPEIRTKALSKDLAHIQHETLPPPWGVEGPEIR